MSSTPNRSKQWNVSPCSYIDASTTVLTEFKQWVLPTHHIVSKVAKFTSCQLWSSIQDAAFCSCSCIIEYCAFRLFHDFVKHRFSIAIQFLNCFLKYSSPQHELYSFHHCWERLSCPWKTKKVNVGGANGPHEDQIFQTAFTWTQCAYLETSFCYSWTTDKPQAFETMLSTWSQYCT